MHLQGTGSCRTWVVGPSVMFCGFSVQGNADKDAAWAAAQQLQAAVSSLTTNSQDTGLRIAGVKMSEQAAILYTAPEALALPDAAALSTTADSLVKVLGELLKEPGVQQLPGPVVICCIKALGAVVLQRANMVHRSMPALLALATKVKEYITQLSVCRTWNRSALCVFWAGDGAIDAARMVDIRTICSLGEPDICKPVLSANSRL